METLISYKKILKLALPVTLSQSSMIISGLIDLAFVSQFGSHAIAAVSVANVIIATLYNFLEGLKTGVTVLVSKASHLKESGKIAPILYIGFILSLAVGIPAALFGKPFSHFVFSWFRDSDMRSYGRDYLAIWLWAVPFSLLSNIIVGLFRGLGDTLTPMKVSLITFVLNAGFDYLFVNGNLGMPEMGAKGSAFGTLLTNFLGLGLMIFFLLRKTKITIPAKLVHAARQNSGEYLKLAVEVGLYTGFMNLAITLFVFMMGFFGPDELAAHQIAYQVFLVTYMLTMGFLVSASIVVPRLVAEHPGEVIIRQVLKICRVSFGLVVVLSTLAFIFAPLIAGFFSPDNHTVIGTAVKTIRIICFAQLFTSLYMVLRGTLTGCGDTRFIAVEGAISGYMVFLPAAYLLAIKLHLHVFGGYLAFMLWCMTDCTAYAIRFFYQKGWLKKQLNP